LTCRFFRWITGLAGGCALLLVAVTGLSACGAPQYTYSADYSANASFKVPYGWHHLTPAEVAAGMHGAPPAGEWTSAFDAGKVKVPADDLQSFLASAPVVLAQVYKLNAADAAGMSYNNLEDAILPVTSGARQLAAASGTFRFLNFKLLNHQMLALGQGVHGIRDIFQYTDPILPGLSVTDTFDEIALTNDVSTQEYLLFMHCTDSCYSQNQKAIDDVMTSFTVRSP
jgi:hypothetical protein